MFNVAHQTYDCPGKAGRSDQSVPHAASSCSHALPSPDWNVPDASIHVSGRRPEQSCVGWPHHDPLMSSELVFGLAFEAPRLDSSASSPPKHAEADETNRQRARPAGTSDWHSPVQDMGQWAYIYHCASPLIIGHQRIASFIGDSRKAKKSRNSKRPS